MPYGIKGKTKKWEQKTEVGQKIDRRIEKCVNDLVADSDFKPKNPKESKKTAAIKVCKSTITKSEEFRKQLA